MRYSGVILFKFLNIIAFFFPFGMYGQTRGVTLEGSLLYWMPSFDETYFVINGSGTDGLGNPTPSGKRINNPVGYNFGFRLEGSYGFCDPYVDFRLRWTHLYATAKTTVSNFDVPAQLWPTAIIPSQPNVTEPFSGTATSHIGVMYQRGECLFDENIGDISCWRFILREGIEWSYIRYHEKVDYLVSGGPQEKIQFHGHTKGLGPQLGVIAFCEPCRILDWYPKCLSFKFLTSASLIAANSKAKVSTIDIFGAENKVTQSSFWRLVPEWNLAFGIKYSSFLWSCPTTLELGYEMATYVRGTSKLIFDDADAAGHSFNQYSDFYVHGLYLDFRFLF